VNKVACVHFFLAGTSSNLREVVEIDQFVRFVICPIQLKVRLVDGTLDVRLLQVSDSTIRTDVARGRGGAVGRRASPALHVGS